MIAEELFQSWWPQEEQFWYRRIQSRAIRPATIALLPTHDVKLSTRILGETLNQHLERNGLLVDERKGCRNGIQGTKDRLLVDKTDLKTAGEGWQTYQLLWKIIRRPMLWCYIRGSWNAWRWLGQPRVWSLNSATAWWTVRHYQVEWTLGRLTSEEESGQFRFLVNCSPTLPLSQR